MCILSNYAARASNETRVYNLSKQVNPEKNIDFSRYVKVGSLILYRKVVANCNLYFL